MANDERYYTATGDIYSVLRTLQSDRSAVNIQFEDSTAPYSSMVLDVSLKNRTFWLDEFSNSVARKRAEEGSPFSLRASINGIRVHAKELTVVRIGEDSRGKFYEIAFPSRMLYLQRRDAFRAWVPGTLMVQASLQSDKRSDKLMGRVQNMSATGCRILLEGKLTPPFEMLEKLDAHINLTLIGQDIECPLEAVYSHHSPESNQTTCGFRFGNLSRPVQIAINRFVTQLQRESVT
ncbi:flagellar brake protein [Pseudohongiella spirulinae]|uniref:flagellar brake protein n=1 Tax=Pseudohongiella spirulinae TaxID=1249552 RepID=UPI0007178E58|nr:flagellar brake protein [Pseudohongiella spirulinae]